ncbi:MAG TPA: ABC transporter permease, partial [Gaiellaceae bacterium]|nr:ABC transporter permease [Gaiellaceae bacterium]
MSSLLHVAGRAARTGYQDYKVIYTWKTWLAGWYLRVLAQVAFFALIGELLGSRERTHFLLVGTAVFLASAGTFVAVASTAWERWSGTLPLLVASPTRPVLVFSTRSLYFVVDAVLTSLGAFFVAAPLFGLELPWPRVLLVVPLVGVVALASYALAIAVGGIAVRLPSVRNVASNVTTLTMLTVCGVVVPVGFYPAPVQWLAQALPLTHGLAAVRDLLAGEPLAALLPNVGLEVLVGLAWLGVALLTFDRLASSGRRDGSIEFGG